MPLPRGRLRTLLREHFRSDAELDAFIGDAFPDVRRRFGDGMERIRKENVVLDYLADDQRLTDALLARDGACGDQPREGRGPLPGRIKILYLAANPSATRQLDLAREVRAIEERIGVGAPRDGLELVPRWAVRALDLQRLLLEDKPHVLHFGCHGSVREQLILEDSGGNQARVEKEALAGLVRDLPGNLRLVVLNACNTETVAEALVRHVDCAIGMSEPIGDEAAITFAAAFYQALGFGQSIESAFRLGKNQLEIARIPEEQTPRLQVKQGVDASKLSLVAPR